MVAPSAELTFITHFLTDIGIIKKFIFGIY